jgi:phosphoribosylaminoimidazole-succinocarboxamide synthase
MGKVRDTYRLGAHQNQAFELGEFLLMVATDRISAFDCILDTAIPDKGRILTRLSAFWFGRTADIVPNHLLSTELRDLPDSLQQYADVLRDRFMLVEKAERIDFECVVRGYLAGSAWAEYQATGEVCGIRLPRGLRLADQLPEPIFTPATKAESGHDQNISFLEMKNQIGEELAQTLADKSLAVYQSAAAYALDRGLILADTKMEFGLRGERLILIDELLTPDSSRYWAVGEYQPGSSPPSFDKQYVRDWLEQSGWSKQPPAPSLPPEVVAGTASRYREALTWLTGETLV